MSRKQISVRPEAGDALRVLGQQIRRARLARNDTVIVTAGRLGVSPTTYQAIERGAPGTAIGTVFNAAAMLAVPLFGSEDPVEIARLRYTGERDMGLLRRRTGVFAKEAKVDGFPR
jgi:transcriptional regulator with XRE-family HTH domain